MPKKGVSVIYALILFQEVIRMNTQILSGQDTARALTTHLSRRGGGGQNALSKAFPAVINDSVRVAVPTDFVLRPR